MPGENLVMHDPVSDLFSQYGLAGLVIACLFSFVVFLIKEHRAERDEWRTFFGESIDQLIAVQKENNQVVRELSRVMDAANNRGRNYDR